MSLFLVAEHSITVLLCVYVSIVLDITKHKLIIIFVLTEMSGDKPSTPVYTTKTQQNFQKVLYIVPEESEEIKTTNVKSDDVESAQPVNLSKLVTYM